MADRRRERNWIESVGAKALGGLTYAGGMMLLLGDSIRWFVRGLLSQRRFGWSAVANQAVRVGVRSTGIVVLVQVFIGVILALQMTPPLRDPWGQEAMIPNIIGVAGFRMLGPILTAVVLSGYAGASIAAELGTMVVAEEIEAMQAMAMNPVRFLVVPRVLATFVMTVLLAVVSDVMIAVGGYLTSLLVLGPGVYIGYWQRMRDQLSYTDLWTGLVMAGVFGLLISLIACFEGLRVRGGAEGVGRATTMTVVYSIVAIICAACMFTVVFYVYEV